VTLAIRPAHSALLHTIREAPGSPRVVVIGAVAVGHHIPLARETGDVDLAIVAEEAVVEAILTGADWVRERGATQRWRHEESEMSSSIGALPARSRAPPSPSIVISRRIASMTSPSDAGVLALVTSFAGRAIRRSCAHATRGELSGNA
jgi:hypothetical protein